MGTLMDRRWFKWSVILSLVGVVGAHWAILQTVAWMGMAVSFSQSDSLAVALQKTFDGRHPCPLCKAVAAGKRSEKRSELKSSGPKLEFVSQDERMRVLPLELDLGFPEWRSRDWTLLDSPPVPPPRLA
jgi:hypothetical protein